MLDKLENIKNRVEELNRELSDPNIFSDNKKMVALSKELKQLSPVAELYEQHMQNTKNIQDAEQMLEIETDETMKQFLLQEIEDGKKRKQEYEEKLKIMLLPKDENDDKNVIMELRGGAGGDEAALFASEIMRMYTKYAEKQGWQVEITDINETELGGVKEATILIKGTNVYEKLKFESGVHRVQRVPETETQGRVHTSTITVAVLPEMPEVELEIDEKDLKIDTLRSSGAGGQHINKTESAIRITHIPSGIVVNCQDQRSQLQNKERAMYILKSKLYDKLQQEANDKYASNRKSQIGTGDRSERIRTYNFPQGRVTDHRIGLTLYSLTLFMEGEIDEMIEALMLADQKAKLEANI